MPADGRRRFPSSLDVGIDPRYTSIINLYTRRPLPKHPSTAGKVVARFHRPGNAPAPSHRASIATIEASCEVRVPAAKREAQPGGSLARGTSIGNLDREPQSGTRPARHRRRGVACIDRRPQIIAAGPTTSQGRREIGPQACRAPSLAQRASRSVLGRRGRRFSYPMQRICGPHALPGATDHASTRATSHGSRCLRALSASRLAAGLSRRHATRRAPSSPDRRATGDGVLPTRRAAGPERTGLK